MEQNPLEEVIKRTTINFPKPLNLKQSEKLFDYISRNLPANLNYTVEVHNDTYYNSEKKKALKSKGPVKITGTISNAKKVMSFDSFRTENKGEDYTHLYSIKFNHLFSNLSEYRPEVIGLWDDVRNLTEKYFEKVLK